MSNFNQITLLGNLCGDPKLHFLENQTAVCGFTLAINDIWNDKSGNKQERVYYVDCSLFGKRGEAFGKYLKKGQAVLITGKLVQKSWVDGQDVKHYKHEVVAREFYFVNGNKSKKADNDSDKHD